MDIRETLANNLQTRMNLNRIRTRSELAKLSGVSPAQIGNILKRQAGTTVDVLQKLANGLACDPWVLLGPAGFSKSGHDIDIDMLIQCFLGLRDADQSAIWRITHQLSAATNDKQLLL